MLVQAKGYDYHWLPMLPPLALLAGDTLNRMVSAFMKQTRYAASLQGVLAIVLLGILVMGIWPKTLPYLTAVT